MPVVYTEHNLQERYHPLTRRANLATWRLQRRVIAVSAEVAESIRRHAGGRVPVETVRNGIEVDHPPVAPQEAAAVRERLALAPDSPVVGTVAVFRTQKRLDLWLRAASRLAADDPALRFVLVGDGPLRGALESLAGELGLADRVRFPGLQQDVRPFLANFDVYLMSSQFEGLPLALLETMAAAVPLVATAVGGIPEVVADGVEGLLVPPGDVEALAGAVRRLLADRTAAAAMAAAARERVRRDFSAARMAAEVEAVYRRALDEGP